MDLYVDQPHQIWFAHRGDFEPCPFPDGGRYDDQAPLDWDWICAALTHVVDHWDQAPADPDDGALHFVLPDPPSHRERQTVIAWGQPEGSCPVADPGQPISDGVHRTEACWHKHPDMVLPIRSEILASHDTGSQMRSQIQDILSAIARADVHLDRSIPANHAWVRQLRRAGGLEIPS